jgi:hypothetical protein
MRSITVMLVILVGTFSIQAAGSLFYVWEIKSWHHPREIFLDDHRYSGVREDHITSSVTAAHRNGGSTRHLLESRR